MSLSGDIVAKQQKWNGELQRNGENRLLKQ